MNKRILSLLLVLLIMTNISSVSFADDKDSEQQQEKETITINSLEQFLDFAENCAESKYSENRIFELKCDINLDGTDFEPIPYFCGEFNGNSHKIINLNITSDGSRQGLFRTIGEGGIVRNIYVSGRVEPDGTQYYIGGIAGETFGEISNCIFEGTITGIENVGGITGYVAENAQVTNCSAVGSIQGEHCVGGIAGINQGSVVNCKNEMDVNTQYFIPEGEASLDISSINSEDYLDITNVGGVVGFSGGDIIECTNKSDIGYLYVGYNVGGIAGRSDGFISECENHGDVLGRKDVGGIAGQQTPYTEFSLDKSKEEDLVSSVYNLNNDINNVSREANELAQDVNEELNNTSDVVNALSEELGKIIYEGQTDLTGLAQAANDFLASYAIIQDLLGSATVTASEELETVGKSMTWVYSALAQYLNVDVLDVEDISLEKAYENNNGAISRSINYGSVCAENCAGGVSGNIGYEVSFDAEDTLKTLEDEGSVINEAREIIFAVIRDCESYGKIECKNDYSGAIAGNMQIGCAINCIGAGEVTSKSGDYVGGIAGKCDGTIKSCYARTALSGEKYVGGISGCVQDIADCYSFALFESYSEYAGAVAGWVEGKAENNIFVKAKPYGIDGVSYSGKTECISFDQIKDYPNIPEIFSDITVEFIGPDNSIIEVRAVTFGEKLDNLPQVPMSEDMYWKWDIQEKENVYYSTKIYGSYYKEITTLSTGEELPEFLAEGKFTENQKLRAIENNYGSSYENVLISKTVEVSDYEGVIKVRMLCEEDGTLYVIDTDGTAAEVEYDTDGRYKVFDIKNGSSIVFVEKTISNTAEPIYIACGAVIVAAALILILILKKRKAKDTKTSENADY